MWDGVDCAMCRDASLDTNAHGDLIAETESSFVRLCVNQTQAGYSIVISKRHVPELHHLTPAERSGFIEDVAAIGQVIAELLAPVKLANLMMGFRMPHVHCHVYPQYQDDDPYRLLSPQDGDVRLSDVEWDDRLSAVRSGFLAIRR